MEQAEPSRIARSRYYDTVTLPAITATYMPLSESSLDDLSSNASYDSDEDYRLAQQEWEESLEQLQQLVSAVMMPFFGKWLGRRWSYWGQYLTRSTLHFKH